MLDFDEKLIQTCVDLAKSAVQHGEAPFGSLIAKDGEMLVTSEQRVIRDNDVTSHAEIVVMREVQKLLKTNDLSGYSLYTICEPCPMCAFMARELKFDRVVISLPSPSFGGLHRWNILEDQELAKFTPYFKNPPEVVINVGLEKAAELYNSLPLFQRMLPEELRK